jgi:hypothetical protein
MWSPNLKDNLRRFHANPSTGAPTSGRFGIRVYPYYLVFAAFANFLPFVEIRAIRVSSSVFHFLSVFIRVHPW